MKIIEIIGIDEKHANLLEKEGYPNVEDLLPLTKSQIKKLAKKLGSNGRARVEKEFSWNKVGTRLGNYIDEI